MEYIVNVAAGVLRLGNKVLLTSRPETKSHPGYWEFPGGKIEKNESAVMALIRELREEINVEVLADDCRMLTRLVQNYAGGKIIELDVILVTKWQGEMLPLEGQEFYYQDLHTVCAKTPLLPTTQQILDLFKS